MGEGILFLPVFPCLAREKPNGFGKGCFVEGKFGRFRREGKKEKRAFEGITGRLGTCWQRLARFGSVYKSERDANVSNFCSSQRGTSDLPEQNANSLAFTILLHFRS